MVAVQFLTQPLQRAMFGRVPDVASLDLTGCQCTAMHVAGLGRLDIASRWVDAETVELTAVQGVAPEGAAFIDYLPELEARIPARFVQLATVRPGLVRQLQRRGYAVVGEFEGAAVMRKELKQ